MKSSAILLLTIVLLTGCATSPDKAIQKRWIAMDVQGEEWKKEKYQRLFNKHSTEFEFKDGKFISYQDGVIQGSADYTMAGDGKSLVVMDNGKPQITFKIISLESETLVAMMSGFMSDRDTIIYKVTENSQDKILANKKLSLALTEVQKSWNKVMEQYQLRNFAISELADVVRAAPGFNANILSSYREMSNKSERAGVGEDNLTPEKLAEYQAAQDGMTGIVNQLIPAAENLPVLKTGENYTKFKARYQNTEDSIISAKKRFNDAVSNYNTLAVANGNKPKEVFFKPEAGATK